MEVDVEFEVELDVEIEVVSPLFRFLHKKQYIYDSFLTSDHIDLLNHQYNHPLSTIVI